MKRIVLILFAVVIVAGGLFAVQGWRKMRDYDRISGCLAGMKWLGMKLEENAESLQASGTESVAEAVNQLVESGLMSRDSLRCRCNGTPFQFKGKLSSLSDSTLAETQVLAFEPFSSHHEDVGVVVLFADANVNIIRGRSEFDRVVGSEKGE